MPLLTLSPRATRPHLYGCRRSNGSPIDGICGADQRKAGAQPAATSAATAAADMSFAHAMRAPEAFHMPARQQVTCLRGAGTGRAHGTKRHSVVSPSNAHGGSVQST